MLVERLCASRPDLRVMRRDLAAVPPPHPDENFVDASLMAEANRGPAQIAALAHSEALIHEFEDSAAVVIDTPVHNFTVPSSLKAWIDHLVRPRCTFLNTQSGKVGLLRDRPVRIVVSCGGWFGDTPGAQTDFVTPYLTYVFATIGIADVRVLRIEGLGRGPDQVERAFAAVRDWIDAQAGSSGVTHDSDSISLR